MLTDSLGRKVDFKNTIVIMTSNIGSRQLKEFGQGVGFGTEAKRNSANEYSHTVIENALKRTFAPELRNIFKRVEEMGYSLELTDKAKDFIADKGWDDQFGARPLKRAIQKYVEDVLAEELILHPATTGSTIHIDLDEASQEIKVVIDGI